METKTIIQGSTVFLIILLSSGISYQLADNVHNRKCTTGWEFNYDGEHEGQYSCSSRPGVYYYCMSIRNSSSTINYWCDEADAIKISTNPTGCNKQGYKCHNGIMVRI